MKCIFSLSIFSALLLTLIAVLLLPYFQPIQQYAAGTNIYHVSGNKILDPSGNKFIVKGTTDLYGIWDGQNSGQYGILQYQNMQRDFPQMKSLGINLLRMWVSKLVINNTTMQTELDTAIHTAEQQGFIIELTNAGNPETIQTNSNIVQFLANRYKTDPKIWIEPVNEPDCYGNGQYCNDWNYWHTEWTQYIQVIRAQGFQNPIIIQTPWWSAALHRHADINTTIDTPGYSFSDSNLIYSVHEYPFNNINTWTTTDAQTMDSDWGMYASNHAIIVDEFGPQNTGGAYEGWIQGFLDYLTNWVNNKNGAGAVSFLWFWSSQDSMTGTNIGSYQTSPTLDQWGTDYKTRYLDKISTTGNSVLPTISTTPPQPTSPYVTPTVYCLGSCLHPTQGITPLPTGYANQPTISQSPSPFISPFPSNTPSLIPCPATQSITANHHHRHKRQNNSGRKNNGLLAELLTILKQLLELIAHISGGSVPPLPVPNSPCAPYLSSTIVPSTIQPSPQPSAVNTTTPSVIPTGATAVPLNRSGIMTAPTGYSKLIFDDTFHGQTLDSTKWIAQMSDPGGIWCGQGGINCPNSFVGYPPHFNAEYGNPDEVVVSNGLTLNAKRDNTYSGYTWKTGYVSTYNKFTFNRGYVQIKAKMPDSTTGAWAGIWFLEKGSAGEIDLQESGYTGCGSTLVNQCLAVNVHASGNSQKLYTTGLDLSSAYHTYGMDYQPGKSITMFIDGKQVIHYTSNIPTGAYDIILTETMAQNASGWHTLINTTTPSPLSPYQVGEVQVWQ